MFEQQVNPALRSITNQRFALAEIRKEILLSRTDIEVLAYARQKATFSVYELKNFYTQTNIQQLRTSVMRLQRLMLIEIIKQGIKNKPSIYWISVKGENTIDRYATMISF
jgi:hypothetical protein